MSKPANDVLIRRVDVTQATLDQFKDKPFKWGYRDCTRLVAFHLRAMGHCVKLPPAGAYRSSKSAKTALQKAGHATLAKAVDSLGLERIPPASTIAGDLVMLASEDPDLGALGVALGNGRIVGYHLDADGACILQPNDWQAAWRVWPR